MRIRLTWASRGVWRHRRPGGWFDDVLTRAKVEGASWHILRHTFASRLVMSGVNIRTVAELLTVRTLQMAMRYAHLAPDYRMNAVQRMHKAFVAPKNVRSDRKSGTPRSDNGAVVH